MNKREVTEDKYKDIKSYILGKYNGKVQTVTFSIEY